MLANKIAMTHCMQQKIVHLSQILILIAKVSLLFFLFVIRTVS